MITPMGDSSTSPTFREEQYYRALPPFRLLTVVSTLFGWFLIVWVVGLGRPLGALAMPTWLALVLGLGFGVVPLLVYGRLRMLTEVYSDHVAVVNGLSSRVRLPLDDVTDVVVRTDDIRDDYNVRNIGRLTTTRTAFTVTTANGVQLTLRDGRHFLIGSLRPEELGAAISAVWRPRRLADMVVSYDE
jgi:hypothetical protein